MASEDDVRPKGLCNVRFIFEPERPKQIEIKTLWYDGYGHPTMLVSTDGMIWNWDHILSIKKV